MAFSAPFTFRRAGRTTSREEGHCGSGACYHRIPPSLRFPRQVGVLLTSPSPPPCPQAYELSTLTGTQVLLLVASETGHVYTFATRKLQPMITSETGKALIQTCLNSPDSPPRSDPTTDQRMSATGFQETDLTYQVSESDSSGETKVCGSPMRGKGRKGRGLAG